MYKRKVCAEERKVNIDNIFTVEQIIIEWIIHFNLVYLYRIDELMTIVSMGLMFIEEIDECAHKSPFKSSLHKQLN